MTARNNPKRKRSGGPRSAAGKARTCRNALKHGLAACYKHDPLLFQQNRKMALALCGEDKNDLLFEQALIVAERDQLYRRVVAYRVFLIERLHDPFRTALSRDSRTARLKVFYSVSKQRDLAYNEFSQLKTKLADLGEDVFTIMNGLRTQPNENWKYQPLDDRDEFGVMQDAIRDLERLRYYERRAWSRRSRAIRQLIAIKALTDPEEEPCDASRKDNIPSES